MIKISDLSYEELQKLVEKRGLRLDRDKIQNYYDYFNNINPEEATEFYIGLLLSEEYGDVEIIPELVERIEGLIYQYDTTVNPKLSYEVYKIIKDIRRKQENFTKRNGAD